MGKDYCLYTGIETCNLIIGLDTKSIATTLSYIYGYKSQIKLLILHMENSQKIISLLLTLVIGTSLTLYFITFNAGLSQETNDWMAFGNFISGISALLNVVVFVWLTISIQKSDENSRKKDRKNQQNIIVSQLRYDDLKLLNSYLSEATNLDKSISNYGKLAHLSYCIQVFRKSRQHLFPIIRTNPISSDLEELCKMLNRMSAILRDSAGLDENGIPCKAVTLTPIEYKTILAQYQDLSAKVIAEFEQFIVSDIS